MRIALIDDDAAERKDLLRRLQGQLRRLSLEGQILAYAGGQEFLAAAKQRPFDLLFLDIYLQDENGIDVARKLRHFDKDCLLVITTSSKDHALEGFRVRALQYLVKPYDDRELTALFDEILSRLPVPDKYIEVSSGGRLLRLRYSQILYAEHFRHQISIYSADGGCTVIRRTFRDFRESLSDSRFFLCSRGLLINLDYAEDFDGSNFLLKNGARLPVSRDLAKAARSAFGDRLFQRGPQP